MVSSVDKLPSLLSFVASRSVSFPSAAVASSEALLVLLVSAQVSWYRECIKREVVQLYFHNKRTAGMTVGSLYIQENISVIL
jgi:hypothetical protein